MTYYVGDQDTTPLLGANNPRYYYALRRTQDGDLYFTRVDQLLGDDEIIINNIGSASDDFTEFEVGVDHFDGRDTDHNRPDANLSPDQYRWDSRSIYYYLNADGELVARVNKSYTYNTNV
jgi:hypothetical protein